MSSLGFFNNVAALMRAQLAAEPESGEEIFNGLVTALAVHVAGCMSADDRDKLMAQIEIEFPPLVAVMVMSRKSELGLALDIEDTGKPS